MVVLRLARCLVEDRKRLQIRRAAESSASHSRPLRLPERCLARQHAAFHDTGPAREAEPYESNDGLSIVHVVGQHSLALLGGRQEHETHLRSASGFVALLVTEAMPWLAPGARPQDWTCEAAKSEERQISDMG